MTKRAAIVIALLAGCSAMPAPVPPPPGPAQATIMAVQRSWHTDVCFRTEDASEAVAALARDFTGARFLCFGFGERQYLTGRNRGVIEMISALFPSQSALLMTVLREPPEAAFGAGNVVDLAISAAGLASLQAYLEASVEMKDGAPLTLGDGPYAGSRYFGGTATYDLGYTCNTWTADALRSAGLPVTRVLFSDGLMRQVRPLGTDPGTDPGVRPLTSRADS